MAAQGSAIFEPAKEIYAAIATHHFHNYERWFGASLGQKGPGSRTSLTPYRLTSSSTAEAYGPVVKILDGSETPVMPGMKYFDFHRMHTHDTQNTFKTYRIRFANSSEGQTNWADAVAAGVYAEICFTLTNNAQQPAPFNIMSKRLPVGTKIWAAVATADAVAQWIEFMIAIHEYSV